MRPQLAIALAIVTSFTWMHAQDMDALARPYVMRAANTARQVLVSEFSKHPERVHHISIEDRRTGAPPQREVRLKASQSVGRRDSAERRRCREVPADSEKDRSNRSEEHTSEL